MITPDQEIAVTRCVCLTCDKSGKRFAAVYGYNPVLGESRKTRRTPEQVAIDKRKKAETLTRKREGIARFNESRKRRVAAGVA